ncbi:hypothetical protein [Moraxella atlantae]|nr:hypothetical protein [Moraxella atlantae]
MAASLNALSATVPSHASSLACFNQRHALDGGVSVALTAAGHHHLYLLLV